MERRSNRLRKANVNLVSQTLALCNSNLSIKEEELAVKVVTCILMAHKPKAKKVVRERERRSWIRIERALECIADVSPPPSQMCSLWD